MTTREILAQARDLISDQNHWTQDDYAQTPAGNTVEPLDPRACRWCLFGALYKVTNSNYLLNDDIRDVLRTATNQVFPGYTPLSVNDSLGHEAVLRVLDLALDNLVEA